MILKYDRICIVPIIAYFFYALLNTIHSCFLGLEALRYFVVLGRYFLYGSIALAFVAIFPVLDVQTLTYVGFMALLLSLNWFLYSRIPLRYEEYKRVLITTCLPLSTLIHFTDKKDLLRALEVTGLIIGFLFLVLLAAYFTQLVSIPIYNTSIGYSVLFPELCMLSVIRLKKPSVRIAYLISAAGYLVAVLLFSSRGPIVAAIVFFLVDYFKRLREEPLSTKQTIIVLATVLLAIILIFFLKEILLFLYNSLEKLGIHSRTLMLFANDFDHMSGRELKYNRIVAGLLSEPYKIHGIAGDTLINAGSYSHSFVLELLYEFGCFFGSIAVLAIFYCVFQCLFRLDYQKNRLTVTALFASIVPLTFSGTLWMNCIFWIWLVCFWDSHKAMREELRQRRLSSLQHSVQKHRKPEGL